MPLVVLFVFIVLFFSFCPNILPRFPLAYPWIKFLTSVKLNRIQSRGTLHISDCLRLVILVIDLSTRSLLVYVGANLLPASVWFSARDCSDMWSKKTFSTPAIHSLRCVCSFQYIGRTNQRLDSRIKKTCTHKNTAGELLC